MTLPACLDVAHPSCDTERRFIEVIVHGTGPLRRTNTITLWFGLWFAPMNIPLHTRVWLEARAFRAISGTSNICVTTLRECDELPT